MAYDMVAGIDGLVPVGKIPPSGCCPPDICEISPESLSCSAINLLPSGPLWDAAKAKGIACGGDCLEDCQESPFGTEEDVCQTLVAHAIYTGRKLYYYIMNSLWPSLREADPETAFTTMDEWLDRLGWVDCYNQFCRDPFLGQLSPYEILGECGVEYCPPTFTEEFSLVYKRGIIRALNRLRRGVIPNLESINFIIAPLYAELVLDPDYGPQNPLVEKCLVLRTTAEFAPPVVKYPCPRTDTTMAESGKQVPLWISPGKGLCAGGPAKAYPLVLAAHCIVRSLLPTCCTICLRREP